MEHAFTCLDPRPTIFGDQIQVLRRLMNIETEAASGTAYWVSFYGEEWVEDEQGGDLKDLDDGFGTIKVLVPAYGVVRVARWGPNLLSPGPSDTDSGGGLLDQSMASRASPTSHTLSASSGDVSDAPNHLFRYELSLRTIQMATPEPRSPEIFEI